MIWPLLEAYLAKFVVIQTRLTCFFHLAVNFLGLRRNRALAWIVNQRQDFLEQGFRHGDLGFDLDQPLP